MNPVYVEKVSFQVLMFFCSRFLNLIEVFSKTEDNRMIRLFKGSILGLAIGNSGFDNRHA